MRIHRLIQALSSQVWAIDPRVLATGVNILRQKLAGVSFSGEDLHAALGVASPQALAEARTAGVAVIPVHGIIEQRMHSLGTSVEGMDGAFTAAMNSRQVDAVVFDVDSPGGVVSGVPEFAEKIAAARGTKPILAVANSLAASAAYWIGSSAKEFWITPSGEAGSIGVYALHEDWSKNLEQEGIAITAISAGKFKTEGAPWEPLAEETQAFYQSQVDEVYGWFVKAVARNRGDSQANVRAGYGEGRVLMADDAVKAKLVDRVGTFEEVLGRAASMATRPSGKRAELLQRDLEVQRARA